MATSNRYIDFDMNFKPHPVTGDLVKKVDVQSIIQSLRTLVFLNFYEKPFHPNIGCGAQGLLFETVSNITSIHIQTTIQQAIKNFEPRAKNVQVAVTPVPTQNQYKVGVQFQIATTQAPFSFNVVLERTR